MCKNKNIELNENDLKVKTTAFVGGICEDIGLVHYEYFDRSVDSD